MALQLGIVGLPNVGKSTLFKALTKIQVEASNYPFCTIDPNVGVVGVPDERIQKLAVMSRSAKTIPAAIEFVDIAGLVAGAHKGEGLGNKFLANIREVDAIVQVVRHFQDANVTHVHGKIDPANDIEVINLELVMADMASAQSFAHKLEKQARGQDKEAVATLAALNKVLAVLEAGQLASSAELDPEKEAPLIRSLNLLTRKPILYVLNVDEGLSEADQQKAIQACVAANSGLRFSTHDVIVISAKIESELAELPDIEAREMMQELGMHSTGLDRLITAGYDLLNLISYFTTGEDETRAWTVTQGMKAPQAAGVIHTDFEAKFIRAEAVAWDKLLEAGSWSSAKDKGWIRMEGKDYVVQDGDVMVFHHS